MGTQREPAHWVLTPCVCVCVCVCVCALPQRDEALDIDVTWTVTVRYLDEQAAARTPERRIRPRQVTPEEVSMMPGFGSSLQGWQPPTVAFADDPFNVKGRNAGKTSEPRAAATTTGGVATSPAPAPSPTPDTAAGEPTGEAPAPADAAAPSPASSEWSCAACTFLNPAGKEVCTICFTPDPDAMRRRLETQKWAAAAVETEGL